MESFKREERYIVFKKSDMDETLSKIGKEHVQDTCDVLYNHRLMRGKEPLKCVVVEHDWPEYEKVWKMIENRVNGVITTNDRFDRLCNNDISTHYRDIKVWVLPSYLLGAFAYWVVAQNPNTKLIDINPALRAFKEHVLSYFKNPLIPEEMTYDLLASIIHEDSFAEIPEILALNELKPDFIDLGALARNVFYMILREHITQD